MLLQCVPDAFTQEDRLAQSEALLREFPHS